MCLLLSLGRLQLLATNEVLAASAEALSVYEVSHSALYAKWQSDTWCKIIKTGTKGHWNDGGSRWQVLAVVLNDFHSPTTAYFNLWSLHPNANCSFPDCQPLRFDWNLTLISMDPFGLFGGTTEALPLGLMLHLRVSVYFRQFYFVDHSIRLIPANND